MSRIRVLERSVAERIAAGEVVERPASVVKELLENSLDAGARGITVEIEGAGLRRIRVIDDGDGIASDDVPLAFERFATSKIARVEDLDGVRTFGFRGEALPSIAAVARVTLTSRTRDAEVASRVVVTGGAGEGITSHGAPPGTTVEVERLFFNTPARLKFMKSPAREQALIAEVVQRTAMAHPDVAFRLIAEGREAGRWPRATVGDRIAGACGAPHDAFILAEGPAPGGAFSAWLGRPEYNRPNRAAQHIFVNRRPIQSALVRRAVEQGYAQLLPVGRFPMFAVFLDVRPDAMDVNIHPRKLEVRFTGESALFGTIAAGVRSSLLASPLVRQVVASEQPDAGAPGAPATQAGPILSIREPDSGYAVPGRPSGASPPRERLPALRPLGQVLFTYIAAEGPDGLYLIDQHAAHERILYERLIAAWRRGGVISQTLAVPLPLDLSPPQMTLLAGHRDQLEQFGFQVEPFGARTALLRAVPASLPGTSHADLLQRALAALAAEGEEGEDPVERLAIATACHTAVRAGDRLESRVIAALLVDLANADDPFTCFHGRPTIVAVSRDQLERWFLRM